MKYFRMIKSASWLKCCLYAIVIIATYYSVLRRMIFYDWVLEDNSYCYLIPFVVIYFIWEKRAALASVPAYSSWAGLIPFALGVVFFWLGELGGELFTQYISIWLIIVGLCWLHLGWEKIKSIWFALIMMLAMFPFPNFVNVRISLYLRLISSQIGDWMLHLYGMPSYREGNIIDLGLIQLHVVDACSGLRYLIPLMILSLILAYWFKSRFWKRAALFLSSVPIAIFVNSFRIALTGILYDIWGPGVAKEFFHGFSGWLIFMFATMLLMAEMWILKRIGRKEIATEVAPSIGDLGKDLNNVKLDSRTCDLQVIRGNDDNIWLGILRQPRFVVAAIVLGLTLGLSQGVEFREKIPVRQPLKLFPTQIEEWTGVVESMEDQFVEQLQFSDYVIMNYRNRQGRYVNFYTAYYESQRMGKSIHSPETCLPGSGWEFREAGMMTILSQGGASIKVNRAFMEREGARLLTYFWFAQRSRVLTSLYQLKVYNFLDALTSQRTDGALIRIMTPVYPDEKPADAEARLKRFTTVIEPVVGKYIPR